MAFPVGDADYVKDMLAELGHVDFWKIAMKPGRPLAFGKINESLFFGLPGNPVSVMVTFYQFVSPALRQLAGQTFHTHQTMQVNCISPIRKRPGRFEFQRGILFTDEHGHTQVKTTGEQGSGILRSMSVSELLYIAHRRLCRHRTKYTRNGTTLFRSNLNVRTSHNSKKNSRNQ